MDDPLNPKKSYIDISFTVCGASNDELRKLLDENNQETAARIDPDGEISFDTLGESKRRRLRKGEIGFNSPHVNGVPITFKEGDRIRTFYNVAKENGRKLVVKLKDCYYLKHLSNDPQLGVPNFDDENIIIYKAKQYSGTYSDGDYYGEDATFASLPNAKTASEISAKPEKYLCALGYFQFTSLIDMKPKKGTAYIHSASEPYNEEQVLNQDRVNNWLEHFGMKKYQIHCSGHAKGEDLLQVVKDIDAKMLYPIHTEHPTEYVKVTRKMTIVEEGKTYKLS